MTRECQVCFGSAITNAGRTWHAQVPDVSPNSARGTKLTGFLLPSGYSQIGFCWLSATCQGTIKPFAYYKIWSAYLKSQVFCFFMKLRHCLLRLAPFLKNIRLCFYPLGDLLLLDKFLDNFCACDFSMHSLLQNGFKYSLSESGMKNWHFARTKYLPYPECQCLKPPLFEEKLMHWLKCYKRRVSPSHIIYLAGLRLLLATFMRHFAFSNPQATCWDPKAWNSAPGSKPMSIYLWQISRCSKKVGTNLANPFWHQ